MVSVVALVCAYLGKGFCSVQSCRNFLKNYWKMVILFFGFRQILYLPLGFSTTTIELTLLKKHGCISTITSLSFLPEFQAIIDNFFHYFWFIFLDFLMLHFIFYFIMLLLWFNIWMILNDLQALKLNTILLPVFTM